MAWGNHQSQAKSFFIPIFLLKQWEKRKREIWTSLGKLGQGKKLEKWAEKAE